MDHPEKVLRLFFDPRPRPRAPNGACRQAPACGCRSQTGRNFERFDRLHGSAIFLGNYQRIEKIPYSTFATPNADASKPLAIISLCAGPEIAALPMIGLTPMTGALHSLKRARMPGTARIGPMLVIGLLGQMIIAWHFESLQAHRAPADSIRPSEANRRHLGAQRSLTKNSWKEISPCGVCTRVSTRSSHMGRIVARTPSSATKMIGHFGQISPLLEQVASA